MMHAHFTSNCELSYVKYFNFCGTIPNRCL